MESYNIKYKKMMSYKKHLVKNDTFFTIIKTFMTFQQKFHDFSNLHPHGFQLCGRVTRFHFVTLVYSGDQVLLKLTGPQLTLPYIIANGFTRPILVEDKAGLDLIVPSTNFTVLDVENYVGCDKEVSIHDKGRQQQQQTASLKKVCSK